MHRLSNFLLPLSFVMTALCCLFMTTGCMERAPKATDSLDADTVDMSAKKQTSLDSLSKMISDAPMPRAADELFDDFFFNYAANVKVQQARTVFPISYVEDGEEVLIQKKTEWEREAFFMADGYYTIICQDKGQMDLPGDTTVSEVTVQKLSFREDKVKEWKFQRIRGKWCMRTIDVKEMSEVPDHEFLQFYNEFATDTLNQETYLAKYVTFSGPDPDEDFSTMEGDIMREQWPMFKPWLPQDEFYCIRYGKVGNLKSDKRYFLIRGISNGIQTDLVFMRKGNTWVLIKVES